jgi:hypothetical protein
MGYKIETTSGTTYTANNVSEEGSFVVLDSGSNSEIKIPTSNVEQIKKDDSGLGAAIGLIALGLGLGIGS